MTAILIHNMAPIMFGSLVLFLLLGYPAAFSLGAVGLIYALIGIELGLFVPDFLQALPERVYGVMSISRARAPRIPVRSRRRPQLLRCALGNPSLEKWWKNFPVAEPPLCKG